MAQADPQIWGGFVEDRHVGTGEVRVGRTVHSPGVFGKAVPLSCMLMEINIRCIRDLMSL